MPKSASAATVKGISKTKRPSKTFGVRHCRGIEERKDGTLMLVVGGGFLKTGRLAPLLSPVSAG